MLKAQLRQTALPNLYLHVEVVASSQGYKSNKLMVSWKGRRSYSLTDPI